MSFECFVVPQFGSALIYKTLSALWLAGALHKILFIFLLARVVSKVFIR